MNKFSALFPKYHPEGEVAEALSFVTDARREVRRGESGEVQRVEVFAHFSRHVRAELLYAAEDACFALYGGDGGFPSLVSFRIIPTFPETSFEIAHVAEVAEEATRGGAVTKGFFNLADFRDDGETIHVRLPFYEEGVDIVRRSGAEDLMSRILSVRFGLNRRFSLELSEDAAAQAAARQAEYDRMLADYESMAQEAVKAEAQRPRTETAAPGAAAATPDHPTYPRARADVLFPDEPGFERESDSVFRIAHMRFTTAGAEHLFGDPFTMEKLTPIAAVEASSRVVIMGEVFSTDLRESRNKDKHTITVGLTDGVYSIYMKRTGAPEEVAWLKDLGVGKSYAVYGRVYRDKFDGDLTFSPEAVMRVKRLLREDNAPEKRTELHLHTTMSMMDAYVEPAKLVSTAVRWGWRSIAVTDHGNVQAFPEVMLEREKQKADGLKILWGMEAYYVNDKARAVYGAPPTDFDDEVIVFDIETTGLDVRACAITEIGAVRVRGGEVIEEFDTFVDPECHIPEEITRLTSITDEMVKGAPKLKEALTLFFAFAGDAMLVAHNANFDCGFIRAGAEKTGLRFENSYLDTVALSHFVNPELKKHKLDNLAEHYGLGDFHHHRAADDARMLALIFLKMQAQMKGEGIGNYERMTEAMSEKSDPLKLRPYHMIIFAKNLAGLKTLYRLISRSYLDFYKRYPRIPRSVLEDNRENLIIGSACEAGELYRAILDRQTDAAIEEIASFYDYLEIQPLCNNGFLITEGKVPDEETLRDINRRIVALGEKLGKPVVATCDAHFLDREDELYRKIILKGMKFQDGDRDIGLYLRTTEEMLAEFAYLGDEKAHEVVIENPNRIADMTEDFRPIPEGRYEPKMDGAEEELTSSCWKRAEEYYGYDDGTGAKIPDIVKNRLSRELDAIISHGFAVLYMIAVRLVAYSESQGYLVGSRGSVGSSFVASMSGISEVNPLPPHYRCPKCRYSEFFTDGSVGSGFDLPDKACPHCGTLMVSDGQDIPFETFLGFHGDKSPDIDLNFSGDVQGKVHKYTEELFGEGNVFRAGTISTLADKTAYGYVMKYLDEKQISLSRAEVDQIVSRTAGVKRTTGQHPGGIIVIPKEYDVHDFTPVQHPADDPHSDIVTTHFQFSYLHDTILKLDELGHDMPTKYKMLERYTNTSVLDVKMNDQKVYRLFESCAPLGITPDDIGGCTKGTYGLPEFGTHFIQGVLEDAKPKTFADLMQISGLTHGTDVWLGNAQDLIKAGICDISKVIGTRDGIMLDLIRYGLPNSDAFKIMESVRKGRGLKPEWEELMTSHGVPDWYIASCKKIKYMFPKAHAAAYVMSAIRLGWYKIHYPMEFYAAFLSVAPGGFDAAIVLRGKDYVRRVIDDIGKKSPQDTTQKDKELVSTLQLVEESLARGIRYLPPDLYKSDYKYFLPEDGKIRMPFIALGGLGETAAQKIVEARADGEFFSVEDLRNRAGLSKSVVELLREIGALKNMSETNQFSFFDSMTF